jgi:outer membrane receptor protein involved in Fe transport
VTGVAEVIGLQPGTTLETNIRGGKTTEVLYLVDGLPVQDLMEGGTDADIPRSVIADMSIQTGGFEPEYGNALSGVVNIVTRRGGDRHAFTTRLESDALWNGQQKDHRTEIDISAGGPVVGEISYLAGLDLLHTDTRWWQDLSRFFSSPIEKRYSGFIRLDLPVTSALRASGQLLYSSRSWHDYEYAWRFNLDGLPPRRSQAFRIAATISHSVSPTFFYTASFSRYELEQEIHDGSRESVDSTMYRWDFFVRYIVDGNRSWWGRSTQIRNLAKADLAWRPNAHHLLKLGVDLTFQSDVLRFEPVLNVFGKPFINKPLLNYSTDYRYFPRMGGLYVQDRLELSRDGMLLNVGFRYDFLDPRAERPTVERIPDASSSYATTITGRVPASTKHLFGPRIGFAAPFAANGFFFINYGVYHQFPLFDYLYSGLNNVSMRQGVGVLVGNPDLRPERTRSWETSVKYALNRTTVLSATYFHKETTDLIDVKTFVPTNARIAGGYGFAEFVNSPFAEASGIEILLTGESGERVTGSISYTYMAASGISENARGGLQYYGWGLEVPGRAYPLSWDQRHTINAAGTLRLPWNLQLSATAAYHSGRPYTYYPSSDGYTPVDPTMEFEPNNARLNQFFLLNTKLLVWFALPGNGDPALKARAYIDIRNLFNTRNERWADSGGKVGGELGDLTAWEPGRRIRLGLEAEF